MWTLLLGLIGLALLVYFCLGVSGYFAGQAFLGVYRSELLRTSSHVAALQAGLAHLARKAPFNVLSEAELEHAAATLASVLDLRALTRIVRLLDRTRDARLLASEDFLRGVVFTYGRMG